MAEIPIPEELPRDILETVVKLFLDAPDGDGPYHSAIGRALLAERLAERARCAETSLANGSAIIAAAIRSKP